jgi:hypothetical protein
VLAKKAKSAEKRKLRRRVEGGNLSPLASTFSPRLSLWEELDQEKESPLTVFIEDLLTEHFSRPGNPSPKDFAEFTSNYVALCQRASTSGVLVTSDASIRELWKHPSITPDDLKKRVSLLLGLPA